MNKEDTSELTQVIVDDLRTLLFWASVGMRLSTGGYKEEDLPHIFRQAERRIRAKK